MVEAEATGDLIGSKIADIITSKSTQNANTYTDKKCSLKFIKNTKRKVFITRKPTRSKN